MEVILAKGVKFKEFLILAGSKIFKADNFDIWRLSDLALKYVPKIFALNLKKRKA